MPNCINCGTDVQLTDKFCRECGRSLTATSGRVDSPPPITKGSQPPSESSIAIPIANEPKPSEIKLSPAEMAEFQQWQKMVKGVNPVQITSVKPATAPQPAIELAKTTGDFFRSFRDISDGIKRDLSNVMDAPTKSATPIASVPATAQAPRISVKPQLSPEEMIEFEKWRQSVKGTSEQPK